MYESLREAITAASQHGGVIRLLSDASNEGIVAAEGSEFVLDLNGHELAMHGPGAGSQGTQTNAFQFLKDSTITIKNGRLVIPEDPALKMGIQNYSNLTLDNVKITGGPQIQYVVSNNFGNVVFKNKTEITAAEGRVAFDAWYGMFEVYDVPGVAVRIADSNVKINGKVEFGKHARASLQNFKDHCSLTIPSDMDLAVTQLTQPCSWTENGDGTKTLRYSGEV